MRYLPMASCSWICCYKPHAMTKISSGLTRAALLSLALGLSGCSSLLNSATKEGDFPNGNIPPPDQAYAVAVGNMKKGDYERAAKDSWTVERWRRERFRRVYPGFEVDVFTSRQAAARGNMRLETVRDSYGQ